jgi:hypothetical protein
MAGLWLVQNLFVNHELIRTTDISITDITPDDLREVADDLEAARTNMNIKEQRDHIQALYPGDENKALRHKLYSTPGLLGANEEAFAKMVKEMTKEESE